MIKTLEHENTKRMKESKRQIELELNTGKP